ncbi:phosphoribosylaminoimidazolesuccinocarboxamide synthase [Anaplasma capra]|uniref:phosphoribosylaminoimidazolesuccinocarboxamide synthase n=1 Tax=Anaplasma capra TaxID=1562740 RepID=UPI0021D5BEA8|nr:phosphoribosylaminoimidazolesuccinocarboxamide synthase [Anaplasma capra]MCU7611738.1 phosphoribosylaminoimidazolesuccinocarboxamide synthase [Anaplasma capra]MCU7612511.1 phosphoribosylaminoimidazolesuccinocarboxamide synthase [Anaplasma capra]
MNTERRALYEGKAKIIFPGPDPDSVVQYFKDDITAFNSQKKDVLPGKGTINNRTSYLLLQYLENHGVKTHLLGLLNDREQLVRRVDMIPMEIVVRNLAYGGFCTRFNVTQGEPISPPVVECYYKNDALSDPMMTEDHVVSLKLATRNEVDYIKAESLRINAILSAMMREINIVLADFKLEFGRLRQARGEIILADEISPDTCRLRNSSDNAALDKDVYRLGTGDTLYGYAEVLRRIEEHLPSRS